MFVFLVLTVVVCFVLFYVGCWFAVPVVIPCVLGSILVGCWFHVVVYCLLFLACSSWFVSCWFVCIVCYSLLFIVAIVCYVAICS